MRKVIVLSFMTLDGFSVVTLYYELLKEMI
jgi:hypothetical protein